MASQSSTQSTIPYELSQDADETFISELESVDQLYFQNQTLCETSIDDCDGDTDDDDLFDDPDVCPLNSFNIPSVNVQPNSEELKENECVNKFFSDGCGCLKIHRKPCSNVISRDSAVMYREQCLELSKEEIDLVIKGQLHSLRTVVVKEANWVRTI